MRIHLEDRTAVSDDILQGLLESVNLADCHLDPNSPNLSEEDLHDRLVECFLEQYEDDPQTPEYNFEDIIDACTQFLPMFS